MVERAPEGQDPEVALSVQEPKKVPAAVGGSGGEEETSSEGPSDAPEAAPPAPEGDPQP